MKSREEIEAKIAEMREQRAYADSCVETAESKRSRKYWEQRVSELTQRLWVLEWVL